MRVALFGASGRLGRALHHTLARRYRVTAYTHSQVDILNPHAIRAALVRSEAQIVVNAAAMTDTDSCERNPSGCYQANALGPRLLAQETDRRGALLVHVSTDYVFDGQKGSPYHEWDEPHPIQEYGRSKMAGENEVRAHARRHLIVRTAWLFGAVGPKQDYVAAVLLAARTGTPLPLFANQIGSPTYLPDLAQAMSDLMGQAAEGTIHVVNAGSISRTAILEAVLRGMNVHLPAALGPGMQAFPIAPRPYSCALKSFVLPVLGVTMRPFQEALDAYLRREAQTHGN